MLSPPASIDPITVIALTPLFAPCRGNVIRSSTTSAMANLGSSKMAATLARS